MSDLKIIRQQSNGFSKQGYDASSDEVYIKVLASFQDMLRILKGARLSVFMCVATHEANIMLGKDSALSLSSIQAIVDYSRPIVVSALDFLTHPDHRFLDELPERGPNGEKQYRVANYAYYGTPRFLTSKKSLPLEKVFNGQNKGKPRPFDHKSRTSARSRSRELDSTDLNLSSSTSAALQILRDAGIVTAENDFADAEITEAQAQAIARWIFDPAPQNPDIRDRASYARHCLLVNPRWQWREEKTHWYSVMEWAVHGNPQHAAYCREHPNEFDCDCGTELEHDSPRRETNGNKIT